MKYVRYKIDMEKKAIVFLYTSKITCIWIPFLKNLTKMPMIKANNYMKKLERLKL